MVWIDGSWKKKKGGSAKNVVVRYQSIHILVSIVGISNPPIAPWRLWVSLWRRRHRGIDNFQLVTYPEWHILGGKMTKQRVGIRLGNR